VVLTLVYVHNVKPMSHYVDIDSVMILSLIAYCDISFTEQKDTRSFHIHFASDVSTHLLNKSQNLSVYLRVSLTPCYSVRTLTGNKARRTYSEVIAKSDTRRIYRSNSGRCDEDDRVQTISTYIV